MMVPRGLLHPYSRFSQIGPRRSNAQDWRGIALWAPTARRDEDGTILRPREPLQSEGLAKVAKDAAAVENISPCEALREASATPPCMRLPTSTDTRCAGGTRKPPSGGMRPWTATVDRATGPRASTNLGAWCGSDT